MAPDFANSSPDEDGDPYEDLEYGDFNPVEEAEFSNFRESINTVDLIRLPALHKFDALLSDKVIEAVVNLFHCDDSDEGLHQATWSEHPDLAAIDECFTSSEPGDVREVFMAVRAIIDRTIDEQYDTEDASETETATSKRIYDQLLRSGCESLVTTMFDSIFQVYQERLQNIFIDPFNEGIQLQQKRIELISCDTDLDEAGRKDHALALYQESLEQAQNISQEILANEYINMDEAYPNFVEMAVGELFDLAPDLMQIPAIDDTDGFDYLTSLESEWRKRYADTFSDRLDETLATAREQLYLPLKELYDSLPQSAKKDSEEN